MKRFVNKEKRLEIKYGMLFDLLRVGKLLISTNQIMLAIALEWYQSKFQKTLVEIEDHFSKYRLSDALMSTYKLIWDDFCSWLLEMVKPSYGSPIDKKTYEYSSNNT